MTDTATMCNKCEKILLDDFDECCEETYTDVYKCADCGDWVEELAEGQSRCKWCTDQLPTPMTWGMFYGHRKI